MRGIVTSILAAMVVLAAAAVAGAERATIGPAKFESVLPPGPGVTTVDVRRFQLDREPVTNAEFLAFVRKHSEWQRDRAPRLLVDSQYLSHWQGPIDLGAGARPLQPVTHVSWFAAKAYCDAQGARLPTWYEWELAAAASETAPRQFRASRDLRLKSCAASGSSAKSSGRTAR